MDIDTTNRSRYKRTSLGPTRSFAVGIHSASYDDWQGIRKKRGIGRNFRVIKAKVAAIDNRHHIQVD